MHNARVFCLITQDDRVIAGSVSYMRHLVESGLVKATGTRWFVDDCDVRVCR
jgi:hypothetical protein